MVKTNFAIITLDCCEGCKNVLFNSEKLVNLLDLATIRFFEEQTPLEDYKKMDVFMIIGLPNKSFQKKMVESIPKDKKVLLIGTCTNLNGVYGLGRKDKLTSLLPQGVDQKVIGCPVEFDEVEQAIKNTMTRLSFKKTKKSVCYECTLNHNPCFLEKEEICAGPLTTDGCNSECLNNNSFCIGCRGVIDGIRKDEVLLMIKSEKSKKDMDDLLKFFNKEED